jgi:hypothetical protein
MSKSSRLENRDPIMKDDQFSLRYGNPIQVIHDVQKQKIDTFEPTKEHVSGTLASAIGDVLATEKKPLTREDSTSFIRDPTVCSDFYHNKNGSVSETEHTVYNKK